MIRLAVPTGTKWPAATAGNGTRWVLRELQGQRGARCQEACRRLAIEAWQLPDDKSSMTIKAVVDDHEHRVATTTGIGRLRVRWFSVPLGVLNV